MSLLGLGASACKMGRPSPPPCKNGLLIPFLPPPLLRFGKLAKSSFQNEGVFQMCFLHTRVSPCPRALCIRASASIPTRAARGAAHLACPPGALGFSHLPPIPVLALPAQQVHPSLPGGSRPEPLRQCFQPTWPTPSPSPKPFPPAPLLEETQREDPHWTTRRGQNGFEVWVSMLWQPNLARPD